MSTFLCSWVLNRWRKKYFKGLFSRRLWKLQTYHSEKCMSLHIRIPFQNIKAFLPRFIQCVENLFPTDSPRQHLLSYCIANGSWTMWIPCCVFKLSSGPEKMSHILVMSHRYDLIPIPCASKCWPCTKEKVSAS